MKCTQCKVNFAVVFVTKLIDGKQVQEGLCLSCAKKQGIKPINQLIEQTGMTEEDIDNLNKQVGGMFESLDMDQLGDTLSLADGAKNPENIPDFTNHNNEGGNPLFSLFNKVMPGHNNNDNNKNDGKNYTRTKTKERRVPKKRKFLGLYGINLTERADLGKIDRVIGRYREIDRVIQILNRRTKNNPVLVGEPGVGKTAIAEGLAVRITTGQVPAKLLTSEVYLLDLAAVVAGTQFRGQFESRMKGILEEVIQNKNIILVIDELHNIMGAGEADGAMNAGNILKPYLARGDIQVIGATTMKEYRKHIEKDSALERRFQPVIIDEPSVSDTIEILKGIKDYYEDYHRVSISEDVLKKAVMLSERYITDRFLPDKAIDVIDEAGSRANLMNEGLVELEALKNELAMVNEEKEQAVSADSIEEYQKAADYKVRECKLREQIAEIEAKTKIVDITEEDIAHVIESWTKIPVQRITEIEAEKLLKLEDRIHKSIIGQKEAVHAISKAIRRARSGMKKRKKPSSFIFVGPTGVGKTELVRVLSKELFESEEAMIRLDMSEYMEKHAVSKLIGSPPGYIGYDDGGQLTEKVRRKPYSVILMDEIEKAHSDVFNMLLQIMEDGRLTDSHGRMVNFENTILIMTSNAGTGSKSNNIGFNNDEYSAMKDKVEDVLKSIFKPEFLNRVDETVVFKELDKKELKEIIKLMLSEVQKELAHKELKLEYTDKAVDFILETGYDIKYGARPLRRTIEKHIEDELAEQFLKGTYKPGDTIKIDSDEKRLIYS